MNKPNFRREHYLAFAGLALLVFGSSWGLAFTPPEQHMAELNRIFFIHVPTAWNTMLTGLAAFVIAIGALRKRTRKWDAALEATVEVTIVLVVMTMIQGMIWGRPTWGDYWDWDPRLTTTAMMAVLFAGVLSLRSFAEEFERRLTWTAVATIIAAADVPIVYKSVEWWDSLHQKVSAPSTVSSDYHWPLRANAVALLFITIWLIIQRARVALLRDADQAQSGSPQIVSDMVAGGD